jgi:hypothetical protein
VTEHLGRIHLAPLARAFRLERLEPGQESITIGRLKK